MSIAALIRRMTDAGAPPEAIALAVEAIEERDAEIERRRAVERDKKRRQRERAGQSRDIPVTVPGNAGDSPAETPASPPSPSLSPTPPITTPPSPIIPQPEKAGASKRGTRLPADWTLTDEWVREAVKAGLPEHLVSREAEIFRDYWHGKAGKDGVKLDWIATWRNWCRRKADERPRGPHAQQQRPRAPHANERSADHLMAAFARRAGPGGDGPVEEEQRDDRPWPDGDGALLDFGPSGGGYSVR